MDKVVTFLPTTFSYGLNGKKFHESYTEKKNHEHGIEQKLDDLNNCLNIVEKLIFCCC